MELASPFVAINRTYRRELTKNKEEALVCGRYCERTKKRRRHNDVPPCDWLTEGPGFKLVVLITTRG